MHIILNITIKLYAQVLHIIQYYTFNYTLHKNYYIFNIKYLYTFFFTFNLFFNIKTSNNDQILI